MCLTEFDENSYKEVIYEDGYADGLAEGKNIGLLEGESIGVAKGQFEERARYTKFFQCMKSDNSLDLLADPEVDIVRLYLKYGIE